MNIRLLAFASAAEALGSSSADLELSADGDRPPTVADLKAELSRLHPSLGALWQRLAVSVDGEVVSDATVLHEGAEVALLPPVSGG